MSTGPAGRIDVRQLKALLRAYFIISTRSMPVGITGGKRVRTLPYILGIYTLLGFFMGATAAAIDSVFVYSMFVHTMTFFVVGTMALNEASEVLFNSRDAEVLGHRPVEPSTLVLAKGLTIFGFCGLMATAVNIGPCVLGVMVKDARGWFGPVHALSVLLETLFLCGAVICVHGVIARFLGHDRFQRFVTAAQILSTVLMVVGFQVLPRMTRFVDVVDFESGMSAIWFLPPTWFAALDASLAARESAPIFTLVAGFGVAATAILLWIGVMRLPGGVSEPTSTATAPATSEQQPVARTVADVGAPRRGWLAHPIWSLWMRDPIERAVFRLCAIHLLRDRALKVRLAAALSYFAVLPILMLLNQRTDRFLPILLVWMCALVPLQILDSLRLSSAPDSAELFLFTPIRNPAALLHGARKAALVFLTFPLTLYAAAIAAWSTRDQPDRLWLLLPAAFLLPPMSMLIGLQGDYVPLSQAARAGERSSQLLAVFLTMIPMGIAFGLLYMAQEAGLLFPAIVLLLALSIGVHIAMRRRIEKRARFALRR